jgi:hypothetical protein
MRRLTLILSDLYLPEDAEGGAIPAALELPSLDWLLRFANRAERIRDWRSWLSADLGATRLSKLPVAQVCALGLLPPAAASTAWLATPVHLEARLDHVRLSDRGLLHVDPEERTSWRAEFAQVFGPQYALHDAGDRAFLLTGAAPAITPSVDPARLLDADIGRALPLSPAAAELRRLATEIEMWLHGARLNVTREQLRTRRVSALWVWGGGAGDATQALGPGDHNALDVLHVHGRDPYLLALAHLARQFGRIVAQRPVKSAPPSFAELTDLSVRTVVELAPMSGPKLESLAALETNWFAPIRAALSAGSLDRMDLLANDRWFYIAARPSWRIWRRGNPWLAQLARKA